MWGTCKILLQTFLGYCLQLQRLVKIFEHKKTTPLQNGVLHILLRKRPFFKFMHSLCENENIPICEESTLTRNKRKCFPLYPDHYLMKEIKEEYKSRL